MSKAFDKCKKILIVVSRLSKAVIVVSTSSNIDRSGEYCFLKPLLLKVIGNVIVYHFFYDFLYNWQQ